MISCSRTRVLVAVLALLLPAGTVAAQSGITLGPMVGANSATVRGPDVEEDFSSRFGAVLGGFLTVPLGSHLAFQPQLLYTSKGLASTDGNSSIKLNYLQVPLLAMLRFPGAGGPAPFLLAGPAVAFDAGCRVEDEGQTRDCDEAEIETASTDVSLLVGAGLNLGRWQVALRYDHGIRSVDESEPPSRVYNRALTLTVGFALRAALTVTR